MIHTYSRNRVYFVSVYYNYWGENVLHEKTARTFRARLASSRSSKLACGNGTWPNTWLTWGTRSWWGSLFTEAKLHEFGVANIIKIATNDYYCYHYHDAHVWDSECGRFGSNANIERSKYWMDQDISMGLNSLYMLKSITSSVITKDQRNGDFLIGNVHKPRLL